MFVSPLAFLDAYGTALFLFMKDLIGKNLGKSNMREKTLREKGGSSNRRPNIFKLIKVTILILNYYLGSNALFHFVNNSFNKQ